MEYRVTFALVWPFAAALCLAPCLFADEEMISDRPEFTESVEPLSRGWAQVEGGFLWERSARDNLNTTYLLSPELRFGMGRGLELRFWSDGVLHDTDRSSGKTVIGRADTAVGLKYKLAGETLFRPGLAVITDISVPTGSAGMGAGTVQPSVTLACAKGVPWGFSLAGSLNWTLVSGGDDRVHQRAVSANASHGLVAGFTGFWEIYGISGEGPGGGTTVMLATGVSRQAGPNIIWDVSVNRRLTVQGPDWQAGFGIALRHPFGLVMNSFKRARQ